MGLRVVENMHVCIYNHTHIQQDRKQDKQGSYKTRMRQTNSAVIPADLTRVSR
jgi:hypothetical protein